MGCCLQYPYVQTQGAVHSPRLVFRQSADRSAEEIVAAVDHFVRGLHVRAVGGGVAVVRDELHGLAEIGLVVVMVKSLMPESISKPVWRYQARVGAPCQPSDQPAHPRFA